MLARTAVLGIALSCAVGGVGPVCAQVPTAGLDSLIDRQGVGPVRLSMSERELVERVGEGKVEHVDFYLGEARCAAGSLVFPGSNREIEIVWSDSSYSEIADIRLRKSGSPWRTPSGVGVGSTLDELEEAAGGPIEFNGFGWEYSGITTWHEEGLEARVWLRPEEGSLDEADPRYEEIVGDRKIRSDHPLVRKMTIRVTGISLSGPGFVEEWFGCG